MARPSPRESKDKFEPAAPHGIQYNTQLPHLIIPEYGRNIQKIVEHACTIKDRTERNNMAHAIIGIMSRLNPNHSGMTDYKHKLWDHLFIISKFKLDVDSPYPKPPKEIMTSKPGTVPYPKGKIRFRHYGLVIERLIEKASSMKAGEEKNAFIEVIANLMKKAYLVWNRNTVGDSVILQELENLSGGKLKVPENFQMVSTNDILARTRNMNPRHEERSERGGHNHGRNRNRHNRNRHHRRGR